MSVNLIQHAFVTGEVSKKVFGRTDLEKYDFGVALARNWFVDWRGGMSTKPGTSFREFIQHDDQPTRMMPFAFSPDIANTYGVLFGAGYIRFFQDGAYLLEDDVEITNITQDNPGAVTATAHGFSNGDWLKLSDIGGMSELNGRTVEVANAGANTFELSDPFGNDLDTSSFGPYTVGGAAKRIYTIANPYSVNDLSQLRVHQIRDVLRITNSGYAVRNLTRIDNTNWTLTIEVFENGVTVPTGLAHTAETAGTSGAIFGVTSVDAEGNESQISDYHYVTNTNNYTTTAGAVILTWNAVTGTKEYRVYRSRVVNDEGQLSASMELGFIGVAFGTEFVDNNYTPDFAKTPPIGTDPFADSTIKAIDVTASGTGYSKTATTVSVSGGGGSGFRGIAIVNDAGNVLGVIVLNGGSGYSASPTVTFGGGGTGATATATVGEVSGNNPAAAITFQQRQLYAATSNNPLTIWATRPGLLSNMDVSRVVAADDPWELTLDSKSVAPIRFMLEMRGGLLVFAHDVIWQLRAPGGGAVTPENALSEPQTYQGIANVPPLNIDTDVLYLQAKDLTARILTFNDFSKLYSGQDVSILSSHLLSVSNPVTSWAYGASPHKMVLASRTDGTMLAFTVVQEHDVKGWTWWSTNGKYKEVIVLEEDGLDRFYVIAERIVNGTPHKFLERIAVRDVVNAEDAWCVDSGLALEANYPAGTLWPSAATGDNVTFTVVGGSPFNSVDVGKVIRVGNGKAKIVTYVSPWIVICKILQEISAINYETGIPIAAESGTWTLDGNVTTVGGLWHLEGETVAILADGNVLPQQVVSNGEVTLVNAASRVVVGLPFKCQLRTLPLTAAEGVIESRRKRIIGVAVRIAESRGLKTGQRLDKLYQMKERTTELWGEPIPLRNTVVYETQAGWWDQEGQTYVVQDEPLPGTVLGLVTEVDIGDDTN